MWQARSKEPARSQQGASKEPAGAVQEQSKFERLCGHQSVSCARRHRQAASAQVGKVECSSKRMLVGFGRESKLSAQHGELLSVVNARREMRSCELSSGA